MAKLGLHPNAPAIAFLLLAIAGELSRFGKRRLRHLAQHCSKVACVTAPVVAVVYPLWVGAVGNPDPWTVGD
jgi:hypothetical protein